MRLLHENKTKDETSYSHDYTFDELESNYNEDSLRDIKNRYGIYYDGKGGVPCKLSSYYSGKKDLVILGSEDDYMFHFHDYSTNKGSFHESYILGVVQELLQIRYDIDSDFETDNDHCLEDIVSVVLSK